MKIIFNPVAGRRRAALLWRTLDVLVSNGVRIDLVETQAPGHATELASAAARQGLPMVVAAGGDGTIAEVAAGLVGSSTHLGIIPLGTANVLARELALPFAPKAVAAALAFGRTRIIWPGVIRQTESSRLFVQMVGVGFDAHIVHTLPGPMKKTFGRTAYVLQTLGQLSRYNFVPFSLRIDGAEAHATSVIVSKGRFYGGPYLLAPRANPGQAGFSVVLFEKGGPGMTLLYGAALPVHLLGHAPGVRHLRANRVEFMDNHRVPVQSDGDKAGCTPLTVTDATGPLHIVVE